MGRKSKKEDIVVKLNGELTVQRAEELKKVLLEKLNGNSRLVLEHEAVDEFDLTYLQLLIASQKYSQKKKKNLTIEKNNSLDELIRLSGVDHEIFNYSMEE